MSTIYVVMQVCQDYGGSDSRPILVTSDLSKAEAKVEEMKARQALRSAVYANIQEYMKLWDKANPRPRNVLEKKKSKDATIPLAEQFQEWAMVRYRELARFTTTFTQAEQDDYRDLNDDLVWEIETVPYEE